MKRSPLRPGLKPLKRTPLSGSARTPARQPQKPMKVRRVSKRFATRRSPAFRKFIRGLPCTMDGAQLRWSEFRSGCIGPVECAHLKSRGAGGDDLGNCIPLCRHHHQVQHQVGVKTFAYWFEPLDFPTTAARLAAEYVAAVGPPQEET